MLTMSGILKRTFLALVILITATTCMVATTHHVADTQLATQTSCETHHCASEGEAGMSLVGSLSPVASKLLLAPVGSSLPLELTAWTTFALILLASLLRKPPNVLSITSRYRF